MNTKLRLLFPDLKSGRQKNRLWIGLTVFLWSVSAISPAYGSKPEHLDGFSDNGIDDVSIAVKAGQTVYAMIGVEGFIRKVQVESEGETRPLPLQGEAMDALTLIIPVERSGEVVFRFTGKQEGRGVWWIDYLVVKSGKKPPRNKAARIWYNAFIGLHDWREKDKGVEPGAIPIQFQEAGFSREAMTSAYLIANDLWAKESQLEAEFRLKARNLLGDVVRRVQTEGFKPLVARLLYRLGQMETTLGFIGDGAANLEQALAHRLDLKMDTEAAKIYNTIGYLHLITGDLDLAEASFSHALLLFKKETDRLLVQLNLAWVERRRENYAAAISWFTDLLRPTEQSGDSYLHLETYDRLGSTLGLAGQYKMGAEALDKSRHLIELHVSDLQRRNRLYSINYLNLAFLYQNWGKPEEALRYADTSLKHHFSGTNYQALHTLYWIKGRAYHQLGNFEEALKYFELSLENAEALRARSGGSGPGYQFFQTSFENIEDIFHVSWRLHQEHSDRGFDRHAFLLLDRIRSQGLMAVNTGSDGGSVIEKIVNRGGKYIGSTRARKNVGSKVRPLFKQSHQTLIEDLSRRFEKQNWGLAAYFLGGKKGYWWFLNRDGFKMGMLPARRDLEDRVARFLDSMGNAFVSKGQYHLLAESLFRDLFPHPEWIEALDHLVILPDGGLHQLPFALLPMPVKEGDAPRLLVDCLSTAYWPSVTLGFRLRSDDRNVGKTSKRFLIFSDPVFESNDIRLGSRQSNSQGFLNRLSFSAKEQRILEACASGRQVDAFSGFTATRRQFLSLPLESYGLIHLATHALCIPEQLGASGLFFSLFDSRGGDLDGYLTTADLSALSFKADLVVLSACRTADGPSYRGEGVVGLSRTFLEGGAGGVIASLWDVDDQATSKLMAYFYQALKTGVDSASALRQAQSQMAGSLEWRDPNYWAGFVLIGSAREIF